MQRMIWTDRKFNIDVPAGWMTNVITRLMDTGIRLRKLTEDVPETVAIVKPNDKWSIKEHIGHLSDLEELHLSRADDFKAHKAELSAWDVTNAATTKANHNLRSLNSLLDEFDAKREVLIQKLLDLDDETQAFQSLHPRLKQMMKPVDMATFVAEHDDHHIASIREILGAKLSE